MARICCFNSFIDFRSFVRFFFGFEKKEPKIKAKKKIPEQTDKIR